MILFLELPELNTPVIFPKNVELQTPHEFNFNDLDYRTQQELTEMCDQDIITFFELPGKIILNRIVSTACKIQFMQFFISLLPVPRTNLY